MIQTRYIKIKSLYCETGETLAQAAQRGDQYSRSVQMWL